MTGGEGLDLALLGVEMGEWKVEGFEDIVACQKARSLTKLVYSATRQPTMRRDPSLADQMRRASVSIMANIAEGYERGYSGDFHRFLTFAKGSCAELLSHFFVALDSELITSEVFDELSTAAQEVTRILGGLRAAVAKKNLGVREEIAVYDAAEVESDE